MKFEKVVPLITPEIRKKLAAVFRTSGMESIYRFPPLIYSVSTGNPKQRIQYIQYFLLNVNVEIKPFV